MKNKQLAFILALIMAISCFTGCGTKKKTNDDPIETPTVNDPTLGDDWVDTEKPGGSAGIKTHQKADSIPESISLIGTDFLPPIGNQGTIGSCSSSSIAYCQFTNAVARYLNSLDPNSDFKPATGDSKYLISSKFTMNFSGAGTAWVYDVLKDHGALVRADSDFYRNSNGGSTAGQKNNPYLQSSSWDVEEGDLTKALNLRLLNNEQIWMNTYNYQLTTTERGMELVEKIKDAVVTGNVVVTGGFSTYWRYGTIDSDGLGDLGKEGDEAIIYSAESGSPGGHQVSIVGYDDNITATVAGVKMKGAFQVANSWGIWKNDGYVWLMYDAVNKISEYEELQSPEVNTYLRHMSFGKEEVQFGMMLHLKEINTNIQFLKRGTTQIEGKTYPTYFIKGETGYLVYGDRNNTAISSSCNDQNALWAVIPASDLSKFPGYNQSYGTRDDLTGGYVLYAVNNENDKILYCGAASSSSNTTPTLYSLSRMYYSYSNICLKLVGYDANKDSQTIQVLGNNGVGDELKRTFSMDQFCFIYWDCDIACNDPGYNVTVELEAKDRESFYIELTRTDASGKTVTHVPAMFQYGENFSNVHPDGEYMSTDGMNYMNFKGEVNGDYCTGYITLSYASMLEGGDSYENYVWGINIVETTGTITVSKITLKDGSGNILSDIIPQDSTKATGKYVFDFGVELENERNIGTFHLQNASGEYMVSDRIVLLKPGEAKDATAIDVTYDYATNEYTLQLDGKIYILDIQGKEVAPGVAVKFNNTSVNRNTQTWRIIQNDDGTVNIRLASNTKYAVGIKNGAVCLVAGSDIKTYGTWTLHAGGTNNNCFNVTKTDSGLSIECIKPETSGTVTVTVTTAAGEVIKTETPVFDADGKALLTLDSTSKGSYIFTLLIDGEASQDINRCVYIIN